MGDGVTFGARLVVEVEVLDPLDGAESGGSDTDSSARCFTGCDFNAQYGGEVFLVSPASIAGLVGKAYGVLPDSWCLQCSHEVGDVGVAAAHALTGASRFTPNAAS